MIDTLIDFGWKYAALAGCVAALLMFSPSLQPRWREWLWGGTGKRDYGRVEGFCFRLAMAFVIWQTLQIRVEYHSLPKPQGLAHFVDVTFLGRPEAWNTMTFWANIALAWYVFGWFTAAPLTYLTLAHVAARSLYASQGAPHHGQNIVGLVLLTQTVLAWVLGGIRLRYWLRYRWQQARWPAWARTGNWTLWWLVTAATIASTYVITGVTKQDASDGKWLENSHHIAGQIVKTYRQNYYNDLDAKYLEGAPPAPLDAPDPDNDRYRHPIPAAAQWMQTHPWLARMAMGSGLLLELTAFLLIFSRTLSLLYGVAIIGFHLGILWLMQLTFPMNIEMALVFLVNVPGWIILLLRRKGEAGGEINTLPAPVEVADGVAPA